MNKRETKYRIKYEWTKWKKEIEWNYRKQEKRNKY